MNVAIQFQPRKVIAPDGKLRQGTAILYTITPDNDGPVSHACTQTWEVVAPSPYNIGREREAYLRRQRPGYYPPTECVA